MRNLLRLMDVIMRKLTSVGHRGRAGRLESTLIFAERHRSSNSAVINDGVVTLDVESKSSPIISSVSLLANILIRNYTNLNTIDAYRSTRTLDFGVYF